MKFVNFLVCKFPIVSENVCKQTFYASHVPMSQKVKGFNVKFSTYYSHMKTKILADFQICIRVPLIKTQLQNSVFNVLAKFLYTFNGVRHIQLMKACNFS